MSRRVFNPPPPKRRIVPRRPLPPEAVGLFTIQVKEEPADVEEPTPEPVAAQRAPEPVAAPASESAPPSPGTPNWIIEARQVDLFAVARTIGVDIVPQRDKPGLAIAPCPSCGHGEGAAVEMNSRWNTRTWKCPACKSFGGNLDLASLTLMGERLGELDDGGQVAVREWFAAQGWCEGD